MDFDCTGTLDGGVDFGDCGKAKLRQYLRNNPGACFAPSAVLPELEPTPVLRGATVPLVTFFQEGYDYRNSDDLRTLGEWIKQEFNGEMVVIGGKAQKVGKSTKRREALTRLIEPSSIGSSRITRRLSKPSIRIAGSIGMKRRTRMAAPRPKSGTWNRLVH